MNLLLSETGKEKVVDWLLSQGVSTILLCAILGFMCYRSIYVEPEQVKAIQAGYQDNADRYLSAIQSVVNTHEKDRELFIRLLEIERQAFLNLKQSTAKVSP